MNGVTLTLKRQPKASIDCRSLLPESLCEMAAQEIAELVLSEGREMQSVGDLFDIDVTSGEQHLRIKGATAALTYIGAGMSRGRLIVDGDAGDYVGYDLSDGELIVNGNVEAFAGSGQKDGLIHIKGSAGDYAGGAADTKMQGLKGGTLMISGACGNYLGYKMRRGIIIAHDIVGDHCANNMIAGTIILGNRCGANLGLGMRRGTVIFLEKLNLDKIKQELPTFNLSGSFSLPIMTVLRHHLHETNHHIAMRLAKIQSVSRYCGDLGYDGLGEILIAN